MTNWVSDNRKIGIGLTGFGSLFLVMGVMFLFDRALLALGNFLFLAGITLLIGTKKTVKFFLNPAKIRGSICFGVGVVLVLIGYSVIGMLIESFGIINLFGFLRRVPGVEACLNLPVVSRILDKIAGVADEGGSFLPTSNRRDYNV